MKENPKNLKSATLQYLLAERQRRRTSAERTHWLMRQNGLRQCVAPNVLEAAFNLLEPDESRQELLAEALHAMRAYVVLLPRGLEYLPACWLKSLPGIWKDLCRIHPRWPGTALSAIGYDSGVLRLTSAQEQNVRLNQLTVYDLMRVEINSRLYPSLWQPLRGRHERIIWVQHPQLRQDLFKLPEAGKVRS